MQKRQAQHPNRFGLATAIVLCALLPTVPPTHADDIVYRYEGNVPPCDESAGWLAGSPCEAPCEESVQNGVFVLTWPVPGGSAGYSLDIADLITQPPGPLWVEWNFRSNHAIGPFFTVCDSRFLVRYEHIHDIILMYGDAVVSVEGGDFVTGLAIDEFHTYRFESPDGQSYRFSVDGVVFLVATDATGANGRHSIAMTSRGGCNGDNIPNKVNEWDSVRLGTIEFGEEVVATKPQSGFVSAKKFAPLDRLSVKFDAPNHVYVEDITITSTAANVPRAIATRRPRNGVPEMLTILLDGPIPFNATTTISLFDGERENIIEYTFAPGDTDGDGDADLRDAAAFQNCFGTEQLSGACLALDVETETAITLDDYAVFEEVLAGPSAQP